VWIDPTWFATVHRLPHALAEPPHGGGKVGGPMIKAVTIFAKNILGPASYGPKVRLFKLPANRERVFSRPDTDHIRRHSLETGLRSCGHGNI
jgi:hypothetical protein